MGLSLTELFGDLLLFLVGIGVVFAAFVGLANALYLYTGFTLMYSEGFSMCPAETSYLDYTSLSDSYCAFAPGDIVVIYRSWPPEVNDIACALFRDGVVCHRVYYSDGSKACFVGDNPKANWTYCFTESEYIGKVIGKLPRFVGIPALSVYVMKESVSHVVDQVSKGKYPV